MLKIFKESFASFFPKIKKLVDDFSIDVSSFTPDHLCYRVATLEHYHEMVDALCNTALLLAESSIQGRPIATFELDKPFAWGNKKIHVIEIPAPKEGRNYREGFEHIEFVIDCSLDEFIAKYPNVPFDTKNISKKNNPDIRLKSTTNAVSIKFHTKALTDIIALEKK